MDKDSKDRLVREYQELKDRYNKLKAYNNRQTVLRNTLPSTLSVEVEYKNGLMMEQQHIMGEYLRILELRLINEWGCDV